jgi:hypothetical protein
MDKMVTLFIDTMAAEFYALQSVLPWQMCCHEPLGECLVAT